MGNLALMICAEDPLAKLIPGFISESERIEAFLWANLCCLAEKVDSPEEKQKILNSSNVILFETPPIILTMLHLDMTLIWLQGALQSMRYFSVGKAYALTGLVMDSEGLNTPFIVFRETPDDSIENATKLLLISFEPKDFVTTKGALIGQVTVVYSFKTKPTRHIWWIFFFSLEGYWRLH